jgi:RNA ligase (TIGR02306 family)
MPDSVVPENIQEQLAKNKITVKNGRIRAINIRNVLSEGLCLDPKEWLNHEVKEGDDVTEELGITKYEPPPPSVRGALRSGKGINFNYENENLKAYYCVEKFKKYPKILAELNQDVVATIKYHGTNFRCGIVKKPIYKKTLWQKFIGLFVKESPQEFLVGSHNKIKVPTKDVLKYWDYYNTDTWWRVTKKYNLESIVRQISENEALLSSDGNALVDVVIYAEIIGQGVQKGYDYGVPDGDLEIRIFDIMIDGKYVDWATVVHLCKCFNLPVAEEVYTGPWSLDVTEHAVSVDEYNGKKYVREGIVIRTLKESWHPKCGRVIFKYLNPAYLLDKKNTEFH